MKSVAIPVLLVLAVGAVVAVYAIVAPTSDRDAQLDTVAVSVPRGAEIYAEACAACHGKDLEGQPNWRSRNEDGRLPAPPHDETGHTWHHADGVLFDITKYGTAAVVGGGYESDMPGFGDRYSDAELRGVLAWIKSRWPEQVRQIQSEITAGNGS